MADITTTGVSNADEAAKQEEEEKRRREIMEQISRLEQEKSGCQDLKTAFMEKRSSTEGIMSRVNALMSKSLQPDINTFSGITADMAETGVSEAQAVMGKRNGSFSNIISAVGVQIALLDSYIAELEGRINTLRASL